jgi:hypothetical protein
MAGNEMYHIETPEATLSRLQLEESLANRAAPYVALMSLGIADSHMKAFAGHAPEHLGDSPLPRLRSRVPTKP